MRESTRKTLFSLICDYGSLCVHASGKDLRKRMGKRPKKKHRQSVFAFVLLEYIRVCTPIVVFVFPNADTLVEVVNDVGPFSFLLFK